MTTQPDIDAIAREAAIEYVSLTNTSTIEGIISAAIRRAQSESYPNLFQGLSRQITELQSELSLARTHVDSLQKQFVHKQAEAIAKRDALEKVAEVADKLERLLSRNCGSNDDWPISLKVSGDYAQELAGKLTALTRALKLYRKAKNDEVSDRVK